MIEKKCEFCDKRGLPLLLVRDAIARIATGAPRAPDLPIALGNKSAHYSKRLVRSGYVYVHDEARKRWECYFVTTEGYFFKLLQTPGVPIVVPVKPFNCPDEGHRAVASCITIADPKRATKVWIGFSDVLWTDAVRKAHESTELRMRHMREIDVQAALGGGQIAHTRPIAEVDSVVSEYAMEETAGQAAYSWSPFAFDARQQRASRLKDECNRLRPGKGLILTLTDPAGIAQELAALMTHNTERFLDDPKFKRKLAVSSAITQIEEGVKSQAEVEEIDAAERLAGQQITNNPLGHWLSESTRRQTEELRTVTPAESDHAAAVAWKAYTAKYNEPGRKQWQAQFNSDFANFDADSIAPLATAHAAWMQSQAMATMVEANFDPTSIYSGMALTELVRLMTAGTQDKKACFDLYGKWLEGSATDRRNLLLRGLICDQDSLAKVTKDAAASSVDINSLPWDKVVEASAKATERLTAGEADELGKYIATFAGPVTRLFLDAAKSKKVFESFVALGMAARMPIVALDVTGGNKAFRAMLIEETLKLAGQKFDKSKIAQALAAELRRLKINGITLEGSSRKRFLFMLDPTGVKGMPAGLTKQAQAQWIARSIKTPEQIESLNLIKWRSAVEGTGRGGLPFAFGIVGAVTQYAALTSLRDEEAKSLQHNKSESLRRIYAQGAQVAGALSDILGQGVGRLATRVPTFALGLTGALSKVLVGTGRVLGIGGSLVMAGFDAWRAREEFLEGNDSAGWGYAVSGALGGVATVLLAIGWTGWGLLVVLALIAWSFIMPMLVDNKIQDWLERVHEWGNLKEKRYQDFGTEQSELKIALAS